MNRGKLTIQEYHYDFLFWKNHAKALGRSVYNLRLHNIEDILKGLHHATLRRKFAFLRTLGRWYLREGFPKLHTETCKVEFPKDGKSLLHSESRQELSANKENVREFGLG
jgi:hypothetical protein